MQDEEGWDRHHAGTDHRGDGEEVRRTGSDRAGWAPRGERLMWAALGCASVALVLCKPGHPHYLLTGSAGPRSLLATTTAQPRRSPGAAMKRQTGTG